MSQFNRSVVRAAFLAIALGLAARPGAAPAADEKGTVDRYGDPLPPGAVARLGSVRFRHGAKVRTAAFSPDGRTVASAGNDAVIRLWEASTGKPLGRLGDSRGRPVRSLAFSPDGKILASGREDGQVQFWDVATGEERTDTLGRRVDNHPDLVQCVVFSPDGKTVASCDRRTIRLSYVAGAAWRELVRTRVWSRWGWNVAFSPDGKTLASAGDDMTVALWDVATGELLRQFTGHDDWVTSVAFAPDGKTLASGSLDATIRLWDVSTGKEVRRCTGHRGHVLGVAFTRGGETLASTGWDRTTRFWDPATGGQRRQAEWPADCTVPLAVSGDGKRLALGGEELNGGEDTRVHLIDVETGRESCPSPGHRQPIAALAFAPDGRGIASGASDGTARVWDAVTGEQRRSFAGAHRYVDAVAFAPDGATLAWGDDGPSVHLWQPGPDRLRTLRGDGDGHHALCFSPDGKMLAAGGHRLGLYDLTRGTARVYFPPERVGIRCPAFSPDGKYLGYQSGNALVLRETAGGEVLHRVEVKHPGLAVRQMVREGGSPKEVAERAARYEGPPFPKQRGGTHPRPSPVTDYQADLSVLSADGRTFVAVGADDTISLWEVATGGRRRLLRGHEGPITAAAFAPGGRRMASGGKDCAVLVWDLLAPLPARPIRPSELWARLIGDDAEAAYSAVCLLIDRPGESVPFIGETLPPRAVVPAEKLDRLIADLDDPSFTVRQRATNELERLDEIALPALRQALTGRPSLELRRRLEQLLEVLDRPDPPERIRGVRAVEVLEYIGTPAARGVLERLATGAPQARLTREARAALQRQRHPE